LTNNLAQLFSTTQNWSIIDAEILLPNIADKMQTKAERALAFYIIQNTNAFSHEKNPKANKGRIKKSKLENLLLSGFSIFSV
jgi:predicted secreted Zn-dependent protease